ncbi:MAG: PAS domain S-box protein [Thermodesulfobacteriota bacterium]
MKLLLRWPLRTTIPSVLILLTVMIGVFSYRYNVTIRIAALEEQSMDEVERAMMRRQRILEHFLLDHEHGWIQKEISDMSADPHLRHIVLANNQLTVVASGHFQMIGASLLAAIPELADDAQFQGREERLARNPQGFVYFTPGKRNIRAICPVFAGVEQYGIRPARVGMFFMDYDLARLKEQTRDEALFETLPPFVSLLLVICLVGIYLHVAVTRRVGRLVEVANQAAAGDREIQAGLSGNDELARVGGALDKFIHERVRHENELRESREFLHLIADSLPVLIAYVDKEERFRFANRQFEVVFGQQRGEIVGKTMAALLGPENYARVEAGIRHALAGESLVREVPLQLAGGVEYLCRGTFLPDLGDDGSVKGFYLMSEDVTEQRKAEAERLRLVTAIEQAEESIVITSPSGEIQYVNPFFEKVSGYTQEEVIGENPRILQSGQHDKRFYRRLWDSLLAKKTWKGVFINRKKNGDLFEEEATVTPVVDSEGKIVNFVGVKRDVSLQRAMERKFRQSQKMEAMGTLAGGIAHDFNNILSSILGYAELVQEELPPEGPLWGHQQQVISASLRARDLVKQILTISRQMEREKNPIQLQPIIKEAIKFLRSSIPSSIEIRQNIAQDCGYINADPTQIHQVVMNLCTNAYHAMREHGGMLSIGLSSQRLSQDETIARLDLPAGDYVRLEVADTGCGMTPQLAERIFEPYFTTKKMGEGTGLGLSVVHGIVKSHGGDIRVYSEPGRGTTMHVYLPCAPGQQEGERQTTARQEIPGGAERVLLVDDEEMISIYLQKSLEKLGYRVTAMTDSQAALERFSEAPQDVDLLITDMTMPHLDGEALSRKALAIRPDLPIILCTGFSDLINEEKARSIGIRKYLSKPVSRQELGWALREILDRKD